MKIHKLVFNSDPNSIRLVKQWVDEIAIKYNICEELYPDILISLTEAVNNAIHHGNKGDKRKNILLICEARKSKLKFEVCDEGKGFCPSNIPDPLSEDRIELENGRGVMIMKELAHNIQFKKRGTIVQMTFKYKSMS